MTIKKKVTHKIADSIHDEMLIVPSRSLDAIPHTIIPDEKYSTSNENTLKNRWGCKCRQHPRITFNTILQSPYVT